MIAESNSSKTKSLWICFEYFTWTITICRDIWIIRNFTTIDQRCNTTYTFKTGFMEESECSKQDSWALHECNRDSECYAPESTIGFGYCQGSGFDCKCCAKESMYSFMVVSSIMLVLSIMLLLVHFSCVVSQKQLQSKSKSIFVLSVGLVLRLAHIVVSLAILGTVHEIDIKTRNHKAALGFVCISTIFNIVAMVRGVLILKKLCNQKPTKHRVSTYMPDMSENMTQYHRFNYQAQGGQIHVNANVVPSAPPMSNESFMYNDPNEIVQIEQDGEGENEADCEGEKNITEKLIYSNYAPIEL